jgi:hypothetical protein
LKFKLKIAVFGSIVLLTVNLFVLYKEGEPETKEIAEINIPKDILNKTWNYYVYVYYDKPNEFFNVIEKFKLKRNAIFRPNGLFENEYFNTGRNSYMKTYGRWNLKDSILNITFKKDNEWVYKVNNDSVRIVGRLVRFSEACLIFRTTPKTGGIEKYNSFLFKCTDKVKLPNHN